MQKEQQNNDEYMIQWYEIKYGETGDENYLKAASDLRKKQQQDSHS